MLQRLGPRGYVTVALLVAVLEQHRDHEARICQLVEDCLRDIEAHGVEAVPVAPRPRLRLVPPNARARRRS